MKFGLFYEWPNPELRDWKSLVDESIEQLQYSEEMGFDFCLIAEHHFSNYGNSPAPLLQALYIAEHTKKLKIATGVLVLPIWDPLRLAEEVAVLDNLTDGRFILGVGRGYQPHELARFNVTVQGSRQRFNETLDILYKAWTEYDSFTYEGKEVSVPHETTVWPKPLQKPYPPMWIAGTSVETMELAAAWDMMPVTTGLLGEGGVKSHLAAFVKARHSLGKTYSGLELGIQSMTAVTETDDEARKLLGYPRWQMRAGRSLGTGRVTNGQVAAEPYEGELDDNAMMDRIFFGNPDTVRAKFAKAASLGATHVSNWMMMGGMPHDKVMASIKRMGEEIIPSLKDVMPPRELYEELLNSSDVTTEQLRDMRTRGPAPSDVT
jgi:alkanesulfonate monooxygenase SsuD/methylene tetrahydromethanopterin reductase-like flavin-dependent oxidoreductase (luciferase family)